jgi:hypothetical protein
LRIQYVDQLSKNSAPRHPVPSPPPILGRPNTSCRVLRTSDDRSSPQLSSAGSSPHPVRPGKRPLDGNEINYLATDSAASHAVAHYTSNKWFSTCRYQHALRVAAVAKGTVLPPRGTYCKYSSRAAASATAAGGREAASEAGNNTHVVE